MCILCAAGISVSRSRSTTFGVFPLDNSSRLLTRKTCVSTAIVGLQKIWFKMTLAVFNPTPGKDVRSFKLLGTCSSNSSISFLLKSKMFFAFALYSPIDLIKSQISS